MTITKFTWLEYRNKGYRFKSIEYRFKNIAVYFQKFFLNYRKYVNKKLIKLTNEKLIIWTHVEVHIESRLI